MIWVLLAGLFVGLAFGFVYPVCAVVYYKARYGRKTTIKAILKEIGW